MDIKRIKVEGLFGVFTHEISFTNKVNIIMGENGVGKTVTLKLIDAIFNARLGFLIDLDFSSIVVTFLRETWKITHGINPKNSTQSGIFVSSSRKDAEDCFISTDMLLLSLPSYFERISEDTWYNKRTHSFQKKTQLAQHYQGGYIPIGDLPVWYQHQLVKNKVTMIQTQRLISTGIASDMPSTLMVKNYSQDITKQIQNEVAKAGVAGADLDRTFPVRLFKLIKGHKAYDAASIYYDLQSLEDYRHKLSSVGLLSEADNNDTIGGLTKELDKNDKTILPVMHQYVKDSWDKLHYFESIYNKVSILKDIINLRFKYKTFLIDSKRGFLFRTDYGSKEEIPVEKLSSGEQNELVLFYELLFKCDAKDLILIDEPEISLHLAWLQAMIYDLIRITNENRATLLIATHSPDLVGDNYELVQNLG